MPDPLLDALTTDDVVAVRDLTEALNEPELRIDPEAQALHACDGLCTLAGADRAVALVFDLVPVADARFAVLPRGLGGLAGGDRRWEGPAARALRTWFTARWIPDDPVVVALLHETIGGGGAGLRPPARGIRPEAPTGEGAPGRRQDVHAPRGDAPGGVGCVGRRRTFDGAWWDEVADWTARAGIGDLADVVAAGFAAPVPQISGMRVGAVVLHRLSGPGTGRFDARAEAILELFAHFRRRDYVSGRSGILARRPLEQVEPRLDADDRDLLHLLLGGFTQTAAAGELGVNRQKVVRLVSKLTALYGVSDSRELVALAQRVAPLSTSAARVHPMPLASLERRPVRGRSHGAPA